MTSVVRASCALYKIFLFIYPGDFRLRFGSEMAATFSDLIRGEWECNGLPGVTRVWRCALGEVLSVAVPLQLHNSMVVAIVLSFVCSSALFIAIVGAMTRLCDSK